MSDQRVTITIDSKNGTKATFDAIARDATVMGDALERTGQRGARSFETWQRAAAAAGAALGALTIAGTRAYGEAEASQARVETAFQNAGLAIEEYRASLESLQGIGLNLGFDDEDVADATAKLVAVTKDYGQAVADVTLAQNIARGEQISLAAATDIVVGAETGRLRGLRALGLAIDETTSKEDALAAAQAKYAGQADAYAATGAATWDRIQNAAENALESIGSKLDGLQGPLLALSAGGTAIGPIKELVGGLKEAEVVTKVLSSGIGQAGLAGAAVVAVAGLGYLAVKTFAYKDAADAAKVATGDLTQYLYRLAAAGKGADFTGPAADAVNDFNVLAKAGAEATEAIRKLREEDLAQAYQDYANASAAATDADHAALDAAQARIDAINAQIATLDDYAISADQINNLNKDIQTLFSQPGINAEKAAAALEYYFDLFRQGRITVEQLVDYVHTDATQTWTRYSDAVIQSGEAQKQFAASMDATTAAMTTQATELERVSALTKMLAQDQAAAGMTAYGQASAAAARTREDAAEMAGALEDSFYVAITATNAWSARQASAQDAAFGPDKQAALVSYLGSMDMLSATLAGEGNTARTVLPANDAIAASLEAQAQRAADAEAAVARYADALGTVPQLADNSAAGFAARAGQAGAALGDAFRVAVGNTNAIGSQSQQVADWANELIGVAGQYAKIDDLLARGVIQQEDYNAAQDAGTRIFAANAAIQDDILEIQTKQAPVLADLTEEQQRYMDHLADLPADQQAVRLAYMDTAESAKALQAAQLAAAAANGELGAQGEATATKMITAAAEADPYLRALLEDMGLISVGADGTITVNFGSVEDAGASIDDLYNVLVSLRDIIAEAFGITVTSNAGDTYAELSGIVSLLNGLDGRTVTYYVNEARTGISVGSPNGPSITPIQQGSGGVVGYAAGGAVVAELAEYGPELVHLAGGGTALAGRRGMYSVPLGSYVETAPMTRLSAIGGPTVNVTVAGNVYGIDDLTEAVTRQLVPAMELAFADHYRSLGAA